MKNIFPALLMLLYVTMFSRLTYAQTVDGWPMVAANPERTSWSSEEVRGYLNIDWYRPIEAYIPYKVQPIVSNGRVYVSTAKGLYAFNATTGALDWMFNTELPLGNSPTIAMVNNVLTAFVGSYDRKIYAINATSGNLIWSTKDTDVSGGFETNPLIISDSYTGGKPMVYVGNRDGYMYAFDGINGAKKWSYQTGGPILFSAAYKGGVLYFASNDMRGYAVNALTGSMVWRTNILNGQGFYSFWPVVYYDKTTNKDYVVFSSGENYRSSEFNLTLSNVGTTGETTLLFSVDNLPNAGNISGPWVAGTDVMDARRITDYLENYPYRHYTTIIDRQTGVEYSFDSDGDGKKEYAPFIGGNLTHSGNKYPPIVNGVDGVLYQATPYIAAGWVSRGGPVGWKFGTSYVSQVHRSGGHASDEPMAYSSGGKMVYWSLCCDREAGMYDVTIPHSQTNRDWMIFSYNLANNSLAPGYQQMYDDGLPGYNNIDGWQIYSGKNKSKNGVYGKHGTTQSPPVPYKGKLFMLKGNSLFSWSNNGTSPKTPLPIISISTKTDTVTPPDTALLKQKLSVEVQKMLTAGHLKPGYHSMGFSDIYGSGKFGNADDYGDIFEYFSSPAETVITLIQVLPYLSASMQTQVKTYLNTYYGPNSTYSFMDTAHVGWKNGTDREYAIKPLDVLDTTVNPPTSQYFGVSYRPPMEKSSSSICPDCGYWSFPPLNFYAGWKYAVEFGGAKAIFDGMSSRLPTLPANYSVSFAEKPYWLNAYIAGYRGYLELQKLAGYQENASVKQQYESLLSMRASGFQKDNPLYSYTDHIPFYFRSLSTSRNFIYMTPELADYMKQNAASKVKEAVNEYEYVAPYWFVSKFDDTVGEGTFQSAFDSSVMLQAKAYILNEPYAQLSKYLDVPAFAVGDLYYLQALVALLKTASNQGVTPPPTGVVSPTPACSLKSSGDADCNGLINLSDFEFWRKEYFKITSTTTADFNGDTKVDLVDFEQWRKGYFI